MNTQSGTIWVANPLLGDEGHKYKNNCKSKIQIYTI